MSRGKPGIKGVVVALSLISMLALGACAATPSVSVEGAAGAAAVGVPARSITVVGQGEVKSAPDVARSNMGVEVLAPTVAEAMQEAQDRMAAVVTALKEQGVAEKDIQTSNFSINFERQGVDLAVNRATGETTTPSGVYRVSNMVQVTIRDLEKVAASVDAAVTAGANNIWGISFALEDTASVETGAREKAVADARARAESLAALSGVSVGDIISISEVIGVGGVQYARAAEGLGGGGGTPIEPGELTYNTQVQVVFAIK